MHAKELSLFNGHKYRAYIHVEICSPSPVIVMSPNEWKFFEWDEKQTNKLTGYMCGILIVIIWKSTNIYDSSSNCYNNSPFQANYIKVYLKLRCIIIYLRQFQGIKTDSSASGSFECRIKNSGWSTMLYYTCPYKCMCYTYLF